MHNIYAIWENQMPRLVLPKRMKVRAHNIMTISGTVHCYDQVFLSQKQEGL